MAIIRLADLAVGKLGGSSSGDKEVTLAGTPEAACLDLDEITLAELEIMLEDAQGAAA
jgi:hypothetical protein